LPFCVDLRHTWEKEPHTREHLGIAPNAFVMTTISNHLDTRLTNEMCHAISQILKHAPHAVYAPMGQIFQPERCMQIFKMHRVENRVRFMGSINAPSQYARSMNLYLNEFPFGSGLSILDAMAAGCPIVSMYDENGPPQAMFGGVYFGIDKVIKTGNSDDYVALACRLIDDKDFYQKWSKHAQKEYEKHADVKSYVHEFEHIVENALHRLKA